MIQLTGYTITAKIHEGPKTFVYRGYRNDDELPVSIKISKAEHPSPSELLRFRQEYELGHQIKGAGVIHYYQ